LDRVEVLERQVRKGRHDEYDCVDRDNPRYLGFVSDLYFEDVPRFGKRVKNLTPERFMARWDIRNARFTVHARHPNGDFGGHLYARASADGAVGGADDTPAATGRRPATRWTRST
jgi:hypothetical protein